MENKPSVFQTFLYPVIVLVAITGLVAVMLSFTNDLTQPVIAANGKKEADLARAIVLEEADAFTELTLDADLKTKTLTTEAYVADNGAGMVITISVPGYGGALPVMVGVAKDGTINKIKVMPNEETAGIGKKVEDDAYSSQFPGTTKETVSTKVVPISGATISSKATILAVEHALTVFEETKGGQG